MADPINHDAASAASTVATRAIGWGIVGAIASFIVPAVVVSVVAGAIFPTVIANGLGLLAGVGGAVMGGFYATVGGAILGAAKGGDRISKEGQAFRDRTAARANSRQNKLTKSFNDGEIKGVSEGYQVGRADGEQIGFQKGQEYVVGQLQQHMESQSAQMDVADKAEGKHAAALASCKCESKVEAVTKQREAQAAAPNQIS